MDCRCHMKVATKRKKERSDDMIDVFTMGSCCCGSAFGGSG